MKGIGLVGALDALHARGFEAQNVAGASAGAIVVALVAGYPVEELREILLGLEFEVFKDKTWEDHIPLVGEYVSALVEGAGGSAVRVGPVRGGEVPLDLGLRRLQGGLSQWRSAAKQTLGPSDRH